MSLAEKFVDDSEILEEKANKIELISNIQLTKLEYFTYMVVKANTQSHKFRLSPLEAVTYANNLLTYCDKLDEGKNNGLED